MKQKIKMIDLHRHFFETSELDKANLSPEDFLRLHFAITKIYDLDLYTMCGNHDSTQYAKKVWDIYNSLPESEKQNLHLYPQSEFNVSINEILTYPDSEHNDEKYVFKKAHILVAAKKGKEEEFFNNTKVYSLWSDMYIRKYKNQELTYKGELPFYDVKSTEREIPDYIGTFNVGSLLKAARNILCEKYCKDISLRIPFDIYENTTEIGLTYTQIRERFIDDSFDYLVKHNLIENTNAAKNKLIADISVVKSNSCKKGFKVLQKFDFNDQKNANETKNGEKLYPKSKEKSFSRLSLKDFNLLFKDTAYFCFAHPETSKIRSETGLPASSFDGIDISSLPKEVKRKIKYYLIKYKLTGKDFIFMPNDSTGVLKKVGKSPFICGDFGSFVRTNICIKAMDNYTKNLGYEIQGVEISYHTLNYTLKKSNEYNWDQFEKLTQMGKAVNCNSSIGDEHFNSKTHTSLIDDAVSRKLKVFNHADKLVYVCQDCAWLDLLEYGKFDKENQSLSIRVLQNDIKSKESKKEWSQVK